jgi:hypothetical protein
MGFWGWRWGFLVPKMAVKAYANNLVDLVVSFPWPYKTPQSEFSIKSYDHLKLRWSDFSFYFFYIFSLFFLSSLSSLFLYMKTNEKWLVIREILVFKFLFLKHWIGINERLDEQSAGANIIGGSKKINIIPQKIAKSFSNGFLKEPLLNTTFNNGFRHRIIVKGYV